MSSPKTIMIVDDSATMIMSVRSTLEMNGFTVQTASDGQEAYGKLATGMHADLIITDINMPNMGGMELIRKVRSMPRHRFTPILTLTTESSANKRDEAKSLGATGWLTKPIAGADMIGVIKRVLPGA